MPNIRVKDSSDNKIDIAQVSIDAVWAFERARSFTTRSIKSSSKLNALYLAVSMIDLTTLEGADTEEKVFHLCSKALNPISTSLIESYLPQLKRPIPSVAAVCVFPKFISTAKKYLDGTNLEIASVATAFPSGHFPLKLKLKDVEECIKMGASEIDMVIDRGAFLSGDYQKVFSEISAVKHLCHERAHLKVILETGELGSLDNVRAASMLAMEAGADFIKTSTGKIATAATMPVTLVMLQAIDDYYHRTGRMIGMKPAGGIRTAKQAIHYLCMVNEVLGEKWLTPNFFRFGASSLLDDLLRQIFKQASGNYFYMDIFSAS